MFDKFIEPADALDGGINHFAMKEFDDENAEAIEKNVVFGGADNRDFSREFGERASREV